MIDALAVSPPSMLPPGMALPNALAPTLAAAPTSATAFASLFAGLPAATLPDASSSAVVALPGADPVALAPAAAGYRQSDADPGMPLPPPVGDPLVTDIAEPMQPADATPDATRRAVFDQRAVATTALTPLRFAAPVARSEPAPAKDAAPLPEAPPVVRRDLARPAAVSSAVSTAVVDVPGDASPAPRPDGADRIPTGDAIDVAAPVAAPVVAKQPVVAAPVPTIAAAPATTIVPPLPPAAPVGMTPPTTPAEAPAPLVVATPAPDRPKAPIVAPALAATAPVVLPQLARSHADPRSQVVSAAVAAKPAHAGNGVEDDTTGRPAPVDEDRGDTRADAPLIPVAVAPAVPIAVPAIPSPLVAEARRSAATPAVRGNASSPVAVQSDSTAAVPGMATAVPTAVPAGASAPTVARAGAIDTIQAPPPAARFAVSAPTNGDPVTTDPGADQPVAPGADATVDSIRPRPMAVSVTAADSAVPTFPSTPLPQATGTAQPNRYRPVSADVVGIQPTPGIVPPLSPRIVTTPAPAPVDVAVAPAGFGATIVSPVATAAVVPAVAAPASIAAPTVIPAAAPIAAAKVDTSLNVIAIDAAVPVAPAPVLADRAIPIAPGLVGPAMQVFGAALAEAPRRDPRDPLTTSDPTVAAITGAAPAAHVVAVGDAQQAPLDLSNPRWPHAMIDRIVQLRDAAADAANATDTRIRLIPDALGSIDVSVKQDGDTLHVRFQADQAATRTLIQDAQPRLAAIAEERGLKLGQSAVDTGIGGGGQFQQQSGQQPQPRANPVRVANPAPSRATTDDGDDAALRGRVA